LTASKKFVDLSQFVRRQFSERGIAVDRARQAFMPKLGKIAENFGTNEGHGEMRNHQFRTWVTAAACWAIIFSPVATAAPAGQAPLVADVALTDGGVLTGQVVTAQGAPVAEAPVVVSLQGREVIRVASNADGAFAAPGLKGGVYQVSTPDSSGVYRLWAPRTAPPAARQGVMIVSGSETVLGQFGPPPGPPMGPPMGPPVDPALGPPPEKGPLGKAMGWIADHPFITAGVVATAIAVPLALEDDDDDAS
jgi:hypothetical protein